MNIILKMSFLFFNNVNISFIDLEAKYTHSFIKILLNNQQVKTINKKKLNKAVVDKTVEVFIVYIISLNIKIKIIIYSL